MFRYIPLLFLCLGCSSQETQEQFEARCTPVLEDILNVQNLRDVSGKDFGLTVQDYRRGKVSQPVWERERDRWHKQEDFLATSANYLYETARKDGCL